MHVLITRPEADAEAWRARLEAAGVAVTIDPMLRIVPAPPSPIDPSRFKGLIVTSRNALRWLADCPNLGALLDLPIVTVGAASAADARALGFRRANAGAGTARDLVEPLREMNRREPGALLHIAGEKLAFDLDDALRPDGIVIERLTVYRSEPADRLGDTTIAGLVSGVIDSVALLSPLTAETWVRLVDEANLSQHHQRLVYVCLSLPIASRLARVEPHDVVVADKPEAEAVLQAIVALAGRANAC